MTRGEKFAGLTVALVTPFRNGEIDFAELTKLVDWHIEQGTDGLAPVGTSDDSLTLPLMSIGGRGVISVVGNIVPRDMKALVKAFDAGNIAEAQRWHRKLFPLCRDMLSVATNPIPLKAALALLGRGTGELRLPMTPLDAAGESKVRRTLADYGLLS